VAFELIYTSVEKGIKPGSKGFCTVAFTDGMPANYIQIAESLSAYRNLYPPHDVNYPKNPVAFSHLSFVVGGRELHFVTRVSAFGSDYSGRNNKLAHSIILRNSEFLEQGPVSVMQSGGFFRESWDEEPHLFRTEKKVTVAAAPVSPQAKAWQQATGDAGWAGFLAQAYLDEPNRSAYLVFNPGMDVLPLIAEAVALMPPEFRWKVTFNTYFISEVRGSTCAWRCVLPDSPLLSTARRSGDTIIDLTAPLGKCNATGPLVEAARSGMQPDWSEYQKQLPTATIAVNAEDDDTYDAIPASKQATSAIATKHTRSKNVSLPGNARFTSPPPPLNKATTTWVPIVFVAVMILVVTAGIVVFTWQPVDRKTNGHPVSESPSTDTSMTGATDDPPPPETSASSANPVQQAPDSVESPSGVSQEDVLKDQNQDFEDRFKAIQENISTNADKIRDLINLKSDIHPPPGNDVFSSILNKIDAEIQVLNQIEVSPQKSILVFLKGVEPIDWKEYSVDGKCPELKFYASTLVELTQPTRQDEFDSRSISTITGTKYRFSSITSTVVINEINKTLEVTGNQISIIHATGKQFQHLILFNTNAGPLRLPQVQLRGNSGNWQIEVPELLKHIIGADGVTTKCIPYAISNSYDVKLQYVSASTTALGSSIYSIEISGNEMAKFHEDVSPPPSPPPPPPKETPQEDVVKEWAALWKDYDNASSVLVKKEKLKSFVDYLVDRQQNSNNAAPADIRSIFIDLKKSLFNGEEQKKKEFDKKFGSKPTLATLKTLIGEKDFENDNKVRAIYDAVHKSEETLKQLFMSMQPEAEKITEPPPQSAPKKNFTPKTLKIFYAQSGMDNDLVVEMTLRLK